MDMKLPEGVPTLPEIMRRYGYRTAAFYTHIFVSSIYGFDRGYDHYEEFDITREFEEGKQPIAGEVLEKVFPWLEQNHDRPFFLAVHIFDPHAEYHPPPPYDKLYGRDYQGEVTGSFKDIRPYTLGFLKIPDENLRHLTALYDGEIRYADEQIGRLFQKLKELDIYDDMLIIVTADHGEEFWDHGGLSHRYTVYQEVVHVPLIIHLPRITAEAPPPGSRVSELVRYTDIPPTILDVAGLPPFESFEGASLLIHKPGGAGWGDASVMSRTVYYNKYFKVCVVSKGVKYLQSFHPEERYEALYDLSLDPAEKNNLIDKEMELTHAMKQTLYSLIREQRGRRAEISVEGSTFFMDGRIKDKLRSLGYLD
jgi:arylsulfatase A-like enzyme